jgi:hypothetical protein
MTKTSKNSQVLIRLRWAESMVACLDHGLSDEEREALDCWESSPAFTSTDEWPGWAPHIGLPPGAAATAPVLLRRLA